MNVNLPVPLYHQLAAILLKKIRSGDYPPGSQIPSEPELAKTFEVGRPTVRQATEILVRRRILTRKRGAGTFVCDKEEEVDLFSLAGTMSAFEKKGINLDRKIVKKISLNTINTDNDNPFKGREAFFFSRVSSIKNDPFLIEDIYLDPALFPNISDYDFSTHSLSGIIEDRYHMIPTHGKQSFSVLCPGKAKAHLLNIPEDEPVLFVRRYLHFREIENAIYSELFCKTDTFVFTQKIGGLRYE
ncbi:MAG: GntR family transcriptional regulator [Spirochaetales bacterium]|nr:GntR family transcriptional regulator [Spirochaetales bacterium]